MHRLYGQEKEFFLCSCWFSVGQVFDISSPAGNRDGMEDIHIVETIGMSRVTIRGGAVISVENPVIRSCPLAKRFAFPVNNITPDAVRKNIQNRIECYGMFTAGREIYSDDPFVGFGASEVISTALTAGLIDAAVIACDGAGTVVTADPRMVQGIGGRMSGLIQTSPIPEVIGRIQDGGGIVPDPDHASIDPVRGIRAARAAGFTRLAVTVAGGRAANDARAADQDAIIIAVHTTGTSPEDAEILTSTADIVTACASEPVRSICGKKALIQAGKSVPVFGMTPNGKKLIVERILAITDPLVVMSASLPLRGESEPEPLV